MDRLRGVGDGPASGFKTVFGGGDFVWRGGDVGEGRLAGIVSDGGSHLAPCELHFNANSRDWEVAGIGDGDL
jgi:hypothetical protein